MKKKTWIFLICAIGLVLLALCVLLATHVICLFHQMAPATCSQPQTCVYCGHTEGDALSHTWVDATCLAPKTCSACGETEGTAPGHTWIDATCLAPKTCSACGETEGTVAEHIPGDWTYGSLHAMGLDCVRYGFIYCTVCSELIEENEGTVDTLHEHGSFIISPADFSQRLDTILKRVLNVDLTATLSSNSKGQAICVVSNGLEEVATIYFADLKSDTYVSDIFHNSENVFNSLFCDYSTTDGSAVLSSFLGIAMCCDPQLTLTGAADLDILSGLVSHNGIDYLLAPVSENQVILLVTLPQ